MSRASLARLLLPVVLAGFLLGCGIPQDAEPRAIADEPDGFQTTTAPIDGGTGRRDLNVYLIDTGTDEPRLADRVRTTNAQPNAVEAVTQLLEPPTQQDQTEGYISRIPDGTTLLDAEEDGDVLSLDLSEQMTGVRGPNLLQAYAQLVYTATQYPDDAVIRVRFLIDGQAQSVPTDGGNTEDPVSVGDYRSLRPGG